MPVEAHHLPVSCWEIAWRTLWLVSLQSTIYDGWMPMTDTLASGVTVDNKI